MKAAILHRLGSQPVFGELPDPVAENDQQVLMDVKASTIKQLDKLKASGKHYTSYPQFPVAVGTDGAGILADGTRAYAMGISGMLAEKALVPANAWVKIPDALDFETAAVLPNALIGSDAALLFRGRIERGQTVLINGATGVSGKIAVQMAKYRGASKVIVTGRNAASLELLKTLGADETISLKDADELIVNRIRMLHADSPIDLVLDYLWGHPMELLLTTLKQSPPYPVKIVAIGEMAGAAIALPSAILRSTQIELLGSGIGSIPMADIGAYLKQSLPELFALAAEGKLQTEFTTGLLRDIENLWESDPGPGKRIVVQI